MKKAQTLLEVTQVMNPTPLQSDELDLFYVSTDKTRDPDLPPISYLHNYFDQPTPHFRLLFASHPGAGKSTELNRLIRDAGEGFWFVKFSAREELDMATLTYVDLIMALMEKLFRQGQAKGLIRNEQVIKPVHNWLNEIIIESKIGQQSDGGAEVNVGIDGLLKQILGMAAKIKASFSLTYESAETMRQVIRPRIADLRNHCNLVLAEISNNLETGKRLVVIVEDTDKLDVEPARKLFVENSGILTDLRTSIIYTVPLFLIHSPDRKRLDSYFETLILPMVKTHSLDGNRFDRGWDVLREIVERRLESRLITDEALDLAIEKTGGIFRDLLKVIQTASLMVRLNGEGGPIPKGRVRSSLNRLKNGYRQSVTGRGEITTDDLYKKLVEIAQSPSHIVAVDPVLQQLLYV